MVHMRFYALNLVWSFGSFWRFFFFFINDVSVDIGMVVVEMIMMGLKVFCVGGFYGPYQCGKEQKKLFGNMETKSDGRWSMCETIWHRGMVPVLRVNNKAKRVASKSSVPMSFQELCQN